jgi:hypothetical protein
VSSPRNQRPWPRHPRGLGCTAVAARIDLSGQNQPASVTWVTSLARRRSWEPQTCLIKWRENKHAAPVLQKASLFEWCRRNNRRLRHQGTWIGESHLMNYEQHFIKLSFGELRRSRRKEHDTTRLRLFSGIRHPMLRTAPTNRWIGRTRSLPSAQPEVSRPALGHQYTTRNQASKPRRRSSSFGSSGIRGGAVRHISATSSGVRP